MSIQLGLVALVNIDNLQVYQKGIALAAHVAQLAERADSGPASLSTSCVVEMSWRDGACSE